MIEKYKEVNGTFYHKETKQEVIDVLERVRKEEIRVVLDYGNVKTGESWNEVYDVTGKVSRSTGTIKMPILVYNKRSLGGGIILTHCIIGIKTSKGKKTLYEFKK